MGLVRGRRTVEKNKRGGKETKHRKVQVGKVVSLVAQPANEILANALKTKPIEDGNNFDVKQFFGARCLEL